MRKYKVLFGALLGIILLDWGSTSALEKVTPLQPITVLPVNGPSNNQPSGLALYQGKLLTVSDKHDDTLFELKIGEDAAEQVPFLKFNPLNLKKKKRLDWEGLTIGPEGQFYMVSETYFRVAAISDLGQTVKWHTPSFKKWGKKRGLFQTKGAYFEGVTLIGDKLLLCAERQPRGLIEFNMLSKKRSAFIVDTTRFSLAPGRVPDFTDLYFFQNKTFALQRGAQLISEVAFEDGKWVEKQSGTFEQIENDPQYHYQTMHYGRAEGLAMDQDKIYVVLDNNNDFRKDRPADKRPLLLILKNSFSFKK